MIGFFLKYLTGFAKIEVSSGINTRLLNLMKNRKIDVWGISENPDTCTFFINRKDINELEKIAEKADVEYKIQKEYGLPVNIKKNKKRFSLLIGIIIFGILIYMESLFIWNISIAGEDDYTKDEILQALSDMDISYGSYKKEIDTVELERLLREHFSELAWISCSIRGTSLYIDVKETLDVFTDTSLTVPSNIIAVKDCSIYSIVTSEGTPVAKIGDDVKKGDILVSGTVNLYDDNAEIMDTHYVPAKAEIKGITETIYDEEFSLTYYKKEYSGNNKTDYTFSIFGYEFKPYNAKVQYDLYDTVTDENRVHIGDSFYMPFGFIKNSFREYSLVMAEYSEDEAVQIAGDRLNTYICELQEKGVQILENNVKISVVDGKCIAKGKIRTLENIGISKEFDIRKEDSVVE
ncbi:MAG: sporulation protein YqfD [Coprococcus sp.]|nr:sporulation protein YqfD [Coprococcus sp.]